MLAGYLQRIAAAEGHVPGVQAQPDQVRIGPSHEGVDFPRVLDIRASVRMETRCQSVLHQSEAGQPMQPVRVSRPLARCEPVREGPIGPSGDLIADLIACIGQEDMTRAELHEQIRRLAHPPLTFCVRLRDLEP